MDNDWIDTEEDGDGTSELTTHPGWRRILSTGLRIAKSGKRIRKDFKTMRGVYLPTLYVRHKGQIKPLAVTEAYEAPPSTYWVYYDYLRTWHEATTPALRKGIEAPDLSDAPSLDVLEANYNDNIIEHIWWTYVCLSHIIIISARITESTNRDRDFYINQLYFSLINIIWYWMSRCVKAIDLLWTYARIAPAVFMVGSATASYLGWCETQTAIMVIGIAFIFYIMICVFCPAHCDPAHHLIANTNTHNNNTQASNNTNHTTVVLQPQSDNTPRVVSLTQSTVYRIREVLMEVRNDSPRPPPEGYQLMEAASWNRKGPDKTRSSDGQPPF